MPLPVRNTFSRNARIARSSKPVRMGVHQKIRLKKNPVVHAVHARVGMNGAR